MATKTIFETRLSDQVEAGKFISLEQAKQLFSFFKYHPLFRWKDANNDCEDRANAICMLLEEWKIPNYKGWVFSGYVFNRTGYLHNLWKYHVAASIPVQKGITVENYILDPATTSRLLSAEEWADNVTDNPSSYYFLKKGFYYIFHPQKIERDNWYKRNKRNYNWTIQGLSGINGLSATGKAQLSFNKKKVIQIEKLFKELKNNKPSFL